MTAALLALVLAIFHGQPITVPMVEAAGGTVTIAAALPDPAWTGWIGCSRTACEIRLVDADQLRHEAGHLADALCDGVMDGSICGWQPQAGAGLDSLGPVEALGIYVGTQEVRE